MQIRVRRGVADGLHIYIYIYIPVRTDIVDESGMRQLQHGMQLHPKAQLSQAFYATVPLHLGEQPCFCFRAINISSFCVLKCFAILGFRGLQIKSGCLVFWSDAGNADCVIETVHLKMPGSIIVFHPRRCNANFRLARQPRLSEATVKLRYCMLCVRDSASCCGAP